MRIRARRDPEAPDWALELPPARSACELVIPADLVTLARVAVPAAQRRRLGGALHYLVEDLVLADPERVQVAQAAVSPPGQLCVGIVEREWLQAVLARLARSGLFPARAVPETLLPPLEPGAWALVPRGDASFVRTGPAEGFVLDQGSPPAALLLALQAAPPRKIVVHGEAPPWAQALGVPVEAGASWDWARGGEAPMDFLAQAERRDWKRTGALAAALALALAAGFAAQWAAERHERRSLTAQMNALYRASFGPEAVILDPALQMRRALEGEFLPLLAKLPAGRTLDSLSYANGRLTAVLAGGEKLVLSSDRAASAGAATLPELRARLADMRAMQKELEARRTRRVSAAPDPRALVQAAGRRSAGDVDFGEWLAWARGMERDYGVRVESCEIVAIGTPGRVRVEASFAVPAQ